ncbi:MAG TPA: YceI family protein [Terriglobales bacterium]|nr:YceI family protein [Terriglobales bacterium]
MSLSKVLIAAILAVFSVAIRPQQIHQSTITIHVGKAGVFSGFGHNHTVVAPVDRAEIDPTKMTAMIVVFTKQMRVVDKDVSEKDLAQIQADMLGPKVLDAQQFPEIIFRSSKIEPAGPQHYRVTGTLELHGMRKEVSFNVTGGPEHYTGTTRLKQTDFGIQPFSAGGGTVKVKNELELEFNIWKQPLASSR